MSPALDAARKKVVIAGFGDTGLLTAIHLADGFEIVGVSPKPLLVSGQELGIRLTRPDEWKRDYLMGFGRYEKLDGVRTVHGKIRGIDPEARRVEIDCADGSERVEEYDALVIASGVTNGFWRTAQVESEAEIEAGLAARAREVAEARTLAVIGGGASAVAVAANAAGVFASDSDNGREVHLLFPRDQVLPAYHPRVRDRITRELENRGVRLHPGHRAAVPENLGTAGFTRAPVQWSTGQPPFPADLVLWAIGNTHPNNAFIPASMLDEAGYVRVDPTLRVPEHEGVFAIGDIAATDPLRSSARNWGYRIVAQNVRATLEGQPEKMKRYEPPKHRWGSILGLQPNGLEVFQPNGGRFRFPRWVVEKLLFPLAVRRSIYRGVRPDSGAAERADAAPP